MIRQAGRKVLEGMREWPPASGWTRELRSTVAALPGRVRKRASEERHSPWAGTIGGARFHPGLAALAAAGAVLAVAGILLYLRKRRQVAAHYSMGEGEAAWEGGIAPASRETEAARR